MSDMKNMKDGRRRVEVIQLLPFLVPSEQDFATYLVGAVDNEPGKKKV